MPPKGTRYGNCGYLRTEEIEQMRKRGITYNIIADFAGVSLRSLKRFLARRKKKMPS